MRAIVGGYTPPKKTRTNLPLPVVGYESATISLARPRADALTPREESGAEGSRTLDLLNAMRLPGCVTVLHRARRCGISGGRASREERHGCSRTVRPAQNPHTCPSSPTMPFARLPLSGDRDDVPHRDE